MSPDLLAPPTAAERMQLIRQHLDSRLPRSERTWSRDTTARDRVFHSIDYIGRAAIPHTTSFYELQEVQRILRRFLQHVALPGDAVVADLGAGDGRLTALLREHGFSNIIAADIDHDNVARLSARFDIDAVCADVSDAALFPQHSFDLIVAWGGLLTVLPDPVAMIDTLRHWLTPHGVLITAEPTLESILLYSLVRGDLVEFERSRTTGTRAAMWDDKEHRYTVYPTRTIRSWFAQAEHLAVLDEQNVGIFPSLLAGGIAVERQFDADAKAALLDAIDFTAIDGVPRQIAFLTRRTA